MNALLDLSDSAFARVVCIRRLSNWPCRLRPCGGTATFHLNPIGDDPGGFRRSVLARCSALSSRRAGFQGHARRHFIHEREHDA